MTITQDHRTASAYIDPEYARAGTTTCETTTSPSYVNRDWATTRAFNRIWAGEVHNRIAEATEQLESTHAHSLRMAAQRYLRRDAKEVLRILAAEYAFTWIDLGRMLGVSVPAIRKWRMDGRISGENHSKLAYLLAFAEILRNRGVSAASWMSVPVVPGYTVAPKHLYCQESAAALLDLACDGRDPEHLLNEIEPDWRNKYDDHGYTVARFDDGTYGIVSR